MKDLKAVRGTYYMARIIAEGEHQTQDFKYAVSDARKIARSLSAFANTLGGRLLVGVKDNGAIAGVRNEEDMYVIEQAALMCCRPAQQLRFTKFVTEGGAMVLRAEIDASPVRPVQALEPDGRWRAYVRVADENIVASPLMVRAWQLSASGLGQLLAFDSAERQLLDMVARGLTPTPDQLTVAACVSKRRAEQAIVGLLAAGAVSMVHTHDGWHLCAAK